MTSSHAWLPLFLLVSFAACFPHPNTPITTSVDGLVLNNGVPLAGAKVFVLQEKGTRCIEYVGPPVTRARFGSDYKAPPLRLGERYRLRFPERAIATDQSGRFSVAGKTGFKFVPITKEPSQRITICVVTGDELVYVGSVSYMSVAKHSHVAIACDIASRSRRGMCEFAGDTPGAV